MNFINTLKDFIAGDSFFYYHGIVLALNWFIFSLIAILLRKTSITLHALAFNLIDISTGFFVVGALLRVYPHIDAWDSWSLLFKGHFIGGIHILI